MMSASLERGCDSQSARKPKPASRTAGAKRCLMSSSVSRCDLNQKAVRCSAFAGSSSASANQKARMSSVVIPASVTPWKDRLSRPRGREADLRLLDADQRAELVDIAVTVGVQARIGGNIQR